MLDQPTGSVIARGVTADLEMPATPTQVDLIEDPLRREMVRMAARDLTTYLEANAVDPTIININGAAWFMIKAIEGPARFAAWRDLIAIHSGPTTSDARFDRDPAALAWARAKVQREVDKLSGWQTIDAAGGEPERSEQWRRHVNHLKRTFIGGDGCVIAAFDERLPQVRAEMDRLAPELAPPLDPTLVRLVAFALDNHETNGRGCHDEPGVDCEPWCHACKILDGVPTEVLEAGRVWLRTAELEAATR